MRDRIRHLRVVRYYRWVKPGFWEWWCLVFFVGNVWFTVTGGHTLNAVAAGGLGVCVVLDWVTNPMQRDIRAWDRQAIAEWERLWERADAQRDKWRDMCRESDTDMEQLFRMIATTDPQGLLTLQREARQHYGDYATESEG